MLAAAAQAGLAVLCFIIPALALPALAPAAPLRSRPKDGLYKGKSTQEHPVTFRVRGGKVGGSVRFTVSGSGGCRVTMLYVVVPVKITSKATLLNLGGVTASGRFLTAPTVRGTISAPSCTSAPRSVAFSARRS